MYKPKPPHSPTLTFTALREEFRRAGYTLWLHPRDFATVLIRRAGTRDRPVMVDTLAQAAEWLAAQPEYTGA